MSYGAADFQAALDVSRETMERLETHRRLLTEWSERINLVGPKELELFLSRSPEHPYRNWLVARRKDLEKQRGSKKGAK